MMHQLKDSNNKKIDVLFYTTGGQGHQEGSQLEEAYNEQRIKGKTILFLSCDESIGICSENPYANKFRCKLCKKLQRRNFNKLLPFSRSQHFISEFISSDINDILNSIQFDYKNIKELKLVRYKNVDIGYGAVSTYVTLTRNLEAQVDHELKLYLDYILRSEVLLIEVINKLLLAHTPDKIIFHNGRFAQYRPLLNICQNNKIDYLCTEGILLNNGIVQKNNFYNCIPHKSSSYTQKMHDFWINNESDHCNREIIARSFYENRRYGKFAGDTIYTKSQIQGLLPSNIQSDKEIICIFNSSEDEYFSIDQELDDSCLYENSFVALRAIFNHYKNDRKKHFYVRIHPNLSQVKYNYHTRLYSLNYDNVTIINAKSNISTYSLIDIASKVIVFESTVGIEAAYWKKPVISLSQTLYSELNIAYQPQSEIELWSLIDNKELPSMYSENVLKYGFFFMSDNHEKFDHINNNLYIYNFFKWRPIAFGYQKIFKSKFLYALLRSIFDKVIIPNLITLSKFKHIPANDEYN